MHSTCMGLVQNTCFPLPVHATGDTADPGTSLTAQHASCPVSHAERLQAAHTSS